MQLRVFVGELIDFLVPYMLPIARVLARQSWFIKKTYYTLYLIVGL